MRDLASVETGIARTLGLLFNFLRENRIKESQYQNIYRGSHPSYAA